MTVDAMLTLDVIVQRLQNHHPWNVQEIVGEPGVEEIRDWLQVTNEIVKELIINQDNLEEQVRIVSAQIMYWGRLVSRTKLIWAVLERKYRVWRDTLALELINPEGKDKGWKKPALGVIEQTARSSVAYGLWYAKIEKAEEAYNATQAVLDGFRAKKEMMRIAVVRHREDSAPTLSI